MAPCALALLILYSTLTPLANGFPDLSGEDDAVLSIWGGFDALPGAKGGEILIQAGANMDTGDGRDGDLTASKRLTSKEYFYRQVVPANLGPSATEPLLVTVAGDVTIHCQYLFNAYVTIEPGANLTLIAGQPLWISPPQLVPFIPMELEILPMPHTVIFANSEPSPGRFQFYTTAHGDIQVIGTLGAAGGDSETPGIPGGAGGTITIINDVCDVSLGTVVVSGGEGCNCSSLKTEAPGSAGGAGGRLAIRAKTIHLSSPILALAVNGGEGGNGATWQHHKMVTDGGNGGDGGKILVDAETIEVPDAGWLPMGIPGVAALTADGGEGGQGGDSYDPAIPPGDGGDGGAPGQIQFSAGTTTSVSLLPGEGGKGGYDREGKMTGAAGHAGNGESSVPPPTLPQKTEDDWTIMTYVAADEEEECVWSWRRLDWVCYTTEDDWVRCLDAMENTCFSDTPVNVVVQMDRYPGKASGEMSIPESADSTWGYWDDTRRGFLTYDGAPGISTVLTPLPDGRSELNTGSPEPLVDFVEWARRVAPAKHEMLVLCGHGGGWRGFLHDSGSPMTWTGSTGLLNDRLEMHELQTAMAGAGKVDILFVHACVGASIEAITSVAGHADFYIATEEIIDYKSFWDDWYAQLGTNSNVEPADLARRIVDTWGSEEAFCLCDMSAIGHVNDSMRVFVQRMCHPISPASEADMRRLWTAAVTALKSTNDLGLGNRDIVHFMYELRAQAWGSALEQTDLPEAVRDVCQSALDVVAALRAACPVVAGENAAWESGRHLNGICVYLPERQEDGSEYSVDPHYVAQTKAGRMAFARDTGWLEFISTLAAKANGQ